MIQRHTKKDKKIWVRFITFSQYYVQKEYYKGNFWWIFFKLKANANVHIILTISESENDQLLNTTTDKESIIFRPLLRQI